MNLRRKVYFNQREGKMDTMRESRQEERNNGERNIESEEYLDQREGGKREK